MGRSPCCSKEGLNKGAWTALEDKTLTSYINAHGEGNWRSLPKRAGLKRCGKSCRLRWLNYLRPDIKRGNISEDEEELIIRLHNLLGNRWSLIAGRLPGRTDNEIKNYWNTTLGKKAKKTSPNSGVRSHTCQSKEEKLLSNSSDVKVTRTKATRCSTKVIVLPPNIPREIDDHKPLETTPVNDHGALTKASDHENGTTSDLLVDELGFCLDIQEPVFDDWDLNGTTTAYHPCLDQGDQNPNMELDPLAFLLDSEEWQNLI